MIDIALRHSRGAFTADLAFTAPRGVTVLSGPSGSGKSTVLDAVAGLLRPQDARIVVDGAVLTDTAQGIALPPHRRRLGIIFQDGRLLPHLTVRQNLRYGRRFAPRGAAPASEAAVVEMLDIGPLLARVPATLSGGERQRVAIGRALLAAPRLILADEPLSALDDARKAEILPYFERLRDEASMPILYVSHSAAEVARMATTVVLMDRGRVLRAGPAAEVLSDPAAGLPGREAGAVVMVRIIAHHPDGLTELDAGGVPLFVPGRRGVVGGQMRLRIAAADVLLARGRPEGLSALNLVPGIVAEVRAAGGTVSVRLSTAAGPILAQITQRSAQQLDVRPGAPLTAIVKSLSWGEDAIGAPAPGGP